MKKAWKKNQIIITALALMIAVAGYVSYTRSNLGGTDVAQTGADAGEDSYEISDDGILEGDIFTDTDDPSLTASADEQTSTASEDNPGEAVLTSSDASQVDFAAEMKLEREQVRAKNKETLLGIVNSTTLTEEQKQAAVNQMIAMTDVAEREAAAEMLLEAKGFTDVVVSITEDAADVVLDMGEVTDAKRAQVEDIVKRKTNISADHIIITPIENQSGQPAEQDGNGQQTDTQTQTQAQGGVQQEENAASTETEAE